MKHGSATDKLIAVKDAFDMTDEANDLFLKAMQEAFQLHYSNCPDYQALCNDAGFLPGDFKSYEDIHKIPYIFVTVLKKFKMVSVPEDEIELTLTSSGTSGEKSAIYLDSVSLSRIRKIVWNIYESYGMADKKEKVNYLCFTYDPEYAKELGTAFSDKLLSGLTSVNKIFFAIKFNKSINDFELDREGCFKALEKYSKEDLPVRILGFPSFLYELMNEYKSRNGKKFKFGKRSFVITGGGWKTLAEKEIPRKLFKEEAGEWLGIPPENVRDLLGMVEHGVPYCECEKGNLHVPVYSRVLVRDPGSLEVLPYGRTGLFHLITPYLHSFPAISLITTDLGRIYKKCPCKRNSPYIEITGRGGLRKHQGCAVTALEILKK